MPWFLKDLSFNNTSGWYEISENGITYHMTIEHTRSLKEYFKAHSSGTIEEWYDNLAKIDKKSMERSGRIRTVDNGFRPDVEYDD